MKNKIWHFYDVKDNFNNKLKNKINLFKIKSTPHRVSWEVTF
jgi:hypothetical protein